MAASPPVETRTAVGMSTGLQALGTGNVESKQVGLSNVSGLLSWFVTIHRHMRLNGHDDLLLASVHPSPEPQEMRAAVVTHNIQETLRLPSSWQGPAQHPRCRPASRETESRFPAHRIQSYTGDVQDVRTRRSQWHTSATGSDAPWADCQKWMVTLVQSAHQIQAGQPGIQHSDKATSFAPPLAASPMTPHAFFFCTDAARSR